MRDLTGDMQTEVAAQTGTTAHFISLEFSGGPEYSTPLVWRLSTLPLSHKSPKPADSVARSRLARR